MAQIKAYNVIRQVRIALAVVTLVCLVCASLQIVWPLQAFGRRLENIQVGQAILAGSGIWLLFWLLATLFFGRVYCSVICPLGVCQDCVARIGRRSRPRSRRHYHYTEPERSPQFIILVAVCLTLALGLPMLLLATDPFQAFNSPLQLLSANSRDAVFASGTALGSAVAMLLLLTALAMAWFKGRKYCNTICPVGALLSIPAAHATLHFDINTDLCTNCYDCVHVCKAHSINLANHSINPATCVACFNCAATCPCGAITWRRGRHKLQMPLVQRFENQTPTSIPQ